MQMTFANYTSFRPDAFHDQTIAAPNKRKKSKKNEVFLSSRLGAFSQCKVFALCKPVCVIIPSSVRHPIGCVEELNTLCIRYVSNCDGVTDVHGGPKTELFFIKNKNKISLTR